MTAHDISHTSNIYNSKQFYEMSFFLSAVIFLYGDSLFGTDVSGYGAPATGYGGEDRVWKDF